MRASGQRYFTESGKTGYILEKDAHNTDKKNGIKYINVLRISRSK